MKASVIIPSLNQGSFIGHTLSSLRSQTFRNFEALLMDGGSTDDTLDIAATFADVLTDVVSEPDSGQSQAINKGFLRAQGDFVAWLNSDDYYFPYTLHWVSHLFQTHPQVEALVGDNLLVDSALSPFHLGRGEWRGLERFLMYWRPYNMHQPSIFFKRRLLERVGLLREDLHLIMDYDYWFRVGRTSGFHTSGILLSASIRHGGTKTKPDFSNYHQEIRSAWREYLQQVPVMMRSRLLIQGKIVKLSQKLKQA